MSPGERAFGFLAMPKDDLVRLTERVLQHGLKPKPEISVQFGAGAPLEALVAVVGGEQGCAREQDARTEASAWPLRRR